MEGLLARAALLLFRFCGSFSARSLLDFCALIPSWSFALRRDHDAPRGRAKAGAASRPLSRRPVILRPGGAPGGAAPVQRASQPRWTFGAAPRERASQPRSSGAIPEPRKLRQGVSQTPGASRRSIRFLERKKGTGGPAPAKQQGRWSVGGAHKLVCDFGLIADASSNAVEWIFATSHVICCP